MMSGELSFWIVTLAVFGAVTTLTIWVGSVMGQRSTVARRLSSAGGQAIGTGATPASVGNAIAAKFASGTEGQTALRRELVLAGYFGQDAPGIYTFARLVCVIGFPVLVYLLVVSGGSQFGAVPKFGMMAGSLLLAYYLPEAYIKRRQRKLQDEFRIAFPDFLDLLVVAVDAGLSIEGALERIIGEVRNGHRELAGNLAIMSSEMRAGRGTIEALHGLAERLGIEEARSFVVLLQQSIELGSNVGDALRVYSDEMREKRLARAEEKAMALPVKMVLPLGAFIFPVILILVLVPVIIKLAGVFGKV